MEDLGSSEELRKISALRRIEKEIKENLSQKLEELKGICLREAELTGRLPKEFPLSAGETAPKVRHRVGAMFKLDDIPLNGDPYLRSLEMSYAVQQKIVEASNSLAAEAKQHKSVKKARRRNCLKAVRKLNDIKEEMNHYSAQMKKMSTHTSCPITNGTYCEGSLVQWSSQQLEQSSSDLQSDVASSRWSCSDTPEGTNANPGRILLAQSSPFKDPSRYPRVTTLHAHCSTKPRFDSDDQLFVQFDEHSKAKSNFTAVLTTLAHTSTGPDVLDHSLPGMSQPNNDFSRPANSSNCTLDSHIWRQPYHKNGSIPTSCNDMSNLVCNTCCPEYQVLPWRSSTAHRFAGCSCSIHSSSDYGTRWSAYHQEGCHVIRHACRNGHGYEETESFSQNFYTTHRVIRNSGPQPGQVSKSMERACVAEHLQDWYQRSVSQWNLACSLQGRFTYERGPMKNLGYHTVTTHLRYSRKAPSKSSGMKQLPDS
ncbi:FERM domain-containing protein 4B-like [Brienomyrus brachyistius]|uniref:FERM domain-containing protein 4B-like n=1 Tax=Brienomyrus brachyistius TaxID=42636 RepID=UPI0020B3FA52|nr:FERM domain-containing protein 4B-like [Brienomyrus brachyistius]